MQVIRLLPEFSPRQQQAVVAIGNFDGLHLGHRAILQQVKTIAQNLGKPAGILTFLPHPRRFFTPETLPFQLTSWRLKSELLVNQNIDFLYVQRFDQRLVRQTAVEFIENILLKQLQVSHLVIGHDFCFGYRRQGNLSLLQQYRDRFSTTVVSAVSKETSTTISSTLARHYLQQGQLDKLAGLLGRPWMVTGRVQQGRQLGRQLGFPTANIGVDDILLPPYGVYAVQVKIDNCNQSLHPGVANLGIRPTVNGQKPLLEVHLFNYHENLYGRRLYVAFHEFIRAEQKFANLEVLRQQIQLDSQQAQMLLKKIDN